MTRLSSNSLMPITEPSSGDAYNDHDYNQTDRFSGFYDIMRKRRLEEWRQRQAYYQRHGYAPAINIIRPGRR
ncbi:hypothetical protein [Larsenimonas rhizosphaerae]|uniref:Uncharacterized protein n=1 Tax=Larsenimonas rhizosphaerae TaxID=2944682 RepID=A0AA41ZCW8_9GAMM|nr:hypothetical protein [Larsenimonas rhizosphaerae]MCM2130303.1 hypothetical protein [Larsenimonas rhizosphaerae]MCX2523007.1 hypothetical protein [Larsenimonas rhizosphaerae]